jgi:hypothetical protein
MLDFASPNAVKERAVLYACISVQLVVCYRTSETVSTRPLVQHSSTTQGLPDRTHHSQHTDIHSPGVSRIFNPSMRVAPTHALDRSTTGMGV